jgi:hypothetical protein
MTHCKGWKTLWILFSTGPSPVAPFIRPAFLTVLLSIMTSQFFIWINHLNSQTTFGQSGDLTISSLLVLNFAIICILFRRTFYSVIILQLVYHIFQLTWISERLWKQLRNNYWMGERSGFAKRSCHSSMRSLKCIIKFKKKHNSHLLNHWHIRHQINWSLFTEITLSIQGWT